MDQRATGVVLRTRPLTETSLIVHWLTREFGRIATVAKGARRSQSPFAGKLDLCYRAELSFHRSRRSDLHLLRELRLLETHPALRRDLLCLQQASYVVKLIEQTTELETPIPEIYDLLAGFLQQLTGRPPRALFILAFEIKLLLELGLLPDPEQISLRQDNKRAVQTLAEIPWEQLAVFELTRSCVAELTRFFQGFIIYHCGKIPAGRNAAFGT